MICVTRGRRRYRGRVGREVLAATVAALVGGTVLGVAPAHAAAA